MRKKIVIEGEEAKQSFPLRTTASIYDFYIARASDKGTSVNTIMNIALLKFKKQVSKSKNKTK